jgi:hypothetical protein
VPYAYAVTETGAGAPAVDGLALTSVRCGALAMVAGDGPGVGEEAYWRHERVVEAAMAGGPVLPMRFGSVLDDPAAFLADRHDALAAALDRVRGAVEVGVRVGAADAGAPQSGTEYLLRRGDAEHVHAELSALARAAVRRRSASFAYLVDRGELERFDERARELGVMCSGPWPPYSFAGA